MGNIANVLSRQGQFDQAIDRQTEVGQNTVPECRGCGKSVRQGRGFAFKGPTALTSPAAEGQAGQITKCIFCAVGHWAMLRRSLSVALVIGTVLTSLNHGDTIFLGEWKPALYWKVPLTYCVPFLVATYGALSNSRR